MKVKHFTNKNKKGSRYISALLLLHDVRQDEIADQLGVSVALVSMVVTNRRGGTKKHGPKITLVRKAIADALGTTIEELWPKKAA
jgi:predicted transcriptional regulator